jgi:hypothetical protein
MKLFGHGVQTMWLYSFVPSQSQNTRNLGPVTLLFLRQQGKKTCSPPAHQPRAAPSANPSHTYLKGPCIFKGSFASSHHGRGRSQRSWSVLLETLGQLGSSRSSVHQAGQLNEPRAFIVQERKTRMCTMSAEIFLGMEVSQACVLIQWSTPGPLLPDSL